MHIKKFEARDLQDALRRIRGELGPDAVILETGQGEGGRVTVLAAMPREAPALSEQAVAGWDRPGLGDSARGQAGREASAGGGKAADGSGASAGPGGPGGSEGAGTSRNAFRRPLPARLETADEAAGAQGKAALGSRQAQAMRAVRQAAVQAKAQDSEELEAARQRIQQLQRMVRSDHFSAIPMPLRQLYFDLTDAEVDADLVHRILERMGSAPLPGQFTPAPPGDVLRLLRGLVEAGGAVASGRPRRVLALAGPTGVGKTTTAAKIAGHAAFRLGMRVALVSIDSYRVFGAQHLATYAALMGLPFHVVEKPESLRAVLDGPLSNSDLVLIDTSGRSPRDEAGIEETGRILDQAPDLEVHLVLAANSRACDMASAWKAFSALPVSHLIFTKLDEAGSRGALYTTALKARLPVAYLGTGQEVPDDLDAATTEALTEGLLGEGANV